MKWKFASIFNCALWLFSIAYTELYNNCLHCIVVFIVVLCLPRRKNTNYYNIFLRNVWYSSEFPSSFNYVQHVTILTVTFLDGRPVFPFGTGGHPRNCVRSFPTPSPAGRPRILLSPTFLHIYSYFLHIYSYFLHISFIFLHIFYIFLHISFIFLHISSFILHCFGFTTIFNFTTEIYELELEQKQ